MSILEDNRTAEQHVQETMGVVDQRAPQKQQRQMLMALGILFLALVLVLVKDRQFWFPPDSAETTPVTQSVSHQASAEPTSDQPKVEAQPAAPAPVRTRQKPASPQPAARASLPEVAGPSITATQRTVLPPLEVEVVAGSKHRTLEPRNNSIRLDLQSDAEPTQSSAMPPTVAVAKPPTVDASTSVRMSPQTAEIVSRSVEPSYPMLAKQMKVQGAVVLQALIGRSGSIEDLHVLSGPAILSSAAMEAVKQWRFKPYFQAGRAVDTEARITVNFTISTY